MSGSSQDIKDDKLALDSTLDQVETLLATINSNLTNGSQSFGDSIKQTYSVSISGHVPPAFATDVFSITGSNTKKVKIRRIIISGIKTTSGVIDIVLVKRSTLNTGGTPFNPSAIKNDSTNNNPTAVITAYSSIPTVGTLVGNLFIKKYFVQGGNNEVGIYEINFDAKLKQPIVLNSATEVLAINFNSTAVSLAGASFNYYIEFTEE